MSIPHGVHWYIGIPRAGKTELARRHAAELSKESGWPVLVIDSNGVANFDGVPHVVTDRPAGEALAELVKALWKDGKHIAVQPPDAEFVDRLIRAAGAGRRVHILIDEARNWCSSRYISPALSRLMRATRHAQVTLQLTTQYFGDINSEGTSCGPHLWIFRCTSPPVIDRLRTEYGLDPERVRALPQYEYIHHYEGF